MKAERRCFAVLSNFVSSVALKLFWAPEKTEFSNK